MFLAEESLFFWVSIEEGFLASLGMTENATFSATCKVDATLESTPTLMMASGVGVVRRGSAIPRRSYSHGQVLR
jgi:hypothetical protein